VYLLDTDVIWALRDHREGAEERLFDWVAAQIPSTLFASAISIIEFESGTRQLERSNKAKATAIRAWMDGKLRPAFDGRIIAIDDAVARRWAQLGYSDFRDGMLAATALQHGLTLATGKPGSFKGAKVKTVNPWAYTPESDDLDWRRASRTAPAWLKTLFVRA
jgi:predicted nucleic acid-binding protein